MITLASESSEIASLGSLSAFNEKLELPHPPIRMPRELWWMVVDELPSLTGRHAAQVFGFKLDERRNKHGAVWNEIFTCDAGWGLNFILVGDDLRDLIEYPKRPASIALLSVERTAKIRSDKARFLSSLREHHLNEKCEVVFHESNIILNVDDVLYSTFFTILTPRQLFSCDEDGLPRSACLYWQDREFTLREISAKDIVGKGGQASTLESVSYICGITLTHPKEMSLKHRHQHLFQHRDCPLAYTHLPHGRNYNGHNILGWELGDDPNP
jgi:hypothetical protein